MSRQTEGNVAVFAEPQQPLAIRAYPVAEPAEGRARLALLRSGICGTDIHIHQGRLPIPGPFIPGHEFLGRVEALGPGQSADAFGQPLSAGAEVIACAAQPCGECFTCRRGETASCLQFGVTFVRDPEEPPHFHGGFGEFLFHPTANLVRLPEGVDLDAAAAFPCAGPTLIRAAAYAGGLEEGEVVVVQGTGPVGLFAVAYAARAGCRVAAIGSARQPARLELARAFGAEEVHDFRAAGVEERQAAVRALAERYGRGDGADVVIEASGAPDAVPEGLGLLRTRGRYLVPGQYSDSGTVAIAPHLITLRALRVIGSGQYTLADVRAYLDFLQRHADLQEAFARTLTDRFAVADANAALARVREGASVKAVFVPAGEANA
jgi:D-arabinose 1-dehydrogenase-like Zn-dependent alcohol dehydrogenase